MNFGMPHLSMRYLSLALFRFVRSPCSTNTRRIAAATATHSLGLTRMPESLANCWWPVNPGRRRRSNVTHVIHAGAARRETHLLKFEKAFDDVPWCDFPDLNIGACGDIGVPTSPLLSDIRKAAHLR